MRSDVKLAIAGTIIFLVAVSSSNQNLVSTSQNNAEDTSNVLRIGYFPNINHAQAVIGIGNGDFQKEMGDTKIEAQIFNAGPSAIEALFAKRIDVAYVGPNPAINGFLKTDGQGLRIVAGVSSGGAVFVVRNDSGIVSEADLGGKKFASPQLGNTQDVALRTYLNEKGYKTSENGGNIQIIPAANSDIFTMMTKKEIDGAWVPEPWGAKLVQETNSHILVDERDLWPNGKFTTAVIVVRSDYLQNHSDIIKKLLKAHVDETLWINSNQDEAIGEFNEQEKVLTGKTIPTKELSQAFSRMTLTYDPEKDSLYKAADDAYGLGFLGDKKPDLTNIFDLNLLNDVLSEKNLSPVP
ncbi:MAG TPA: ABC transporter substrate-binding protein [Candidatus Nitrosotalea sp.]|nr:ABC transporter substrate-binding protein [Candidatus Nitrosotalea sp.]